MNLVTYLILVLRLAGLVENAVIELENINHEENYLGLYIGQYHLYLYKEVIFVFPNIFMYEIHP